MLEKEFNDRAGGELRAERIYAVYGQRIDVRFLGWDGMKLADTLFAPWNFLKPEDILPEPALECSTIVMAPGGAITGAPEYLVSADELNVIVGNVTMCIGRDEGRGCILSSVAAVRDTPELFQRLFLEPAVQFLATRADRVPIHASSVVLNGRPLLIAGPSNSGKSTLLYALHTQGCPVLAEESTCIAYRDGFALWGLAREIGLREEALRLFPRLAKAEAKPQPNGKVKHIVPIRREQRAYPKQTGPVDLIFLTEEEIPGHLRALSTAEARQRLLSNREPGFDLASDYEAAIDALLANATPHELDLGLPPLDTAAFLAKALPR